MVQVCQTQSDSTHAKTQELPGTSPLDPARGFAPGPHNFV